MTGTPKKQTRLVQLSQWLIIFLIVGIISECLTIFSWNQCDKELIISQFLRSHQNYNYNQSSKRHFDNITMQHFSKNNIDNPAFAFKNKSKNINVPIGNRNDIECDVPIGFPRGVPSLKRFKKICQGLKKGGYCYYNQSLAYNRNIDEAFDCKKCVPPWIRDDWINDLTNSLKIAEKETRIKRQMEIQQIISNNMVLRHKDSPILLITLNFGYRYVMFIDI